MPASAAAKSWLSELAGTAGQPAFLTPYADVDAAALSHAGLDADLASAYQLGDAVASKILPSTFGSSADGTGSRHRPGGRLAGRRHRRRRRADQPRPGRRDQHGGAQQRRAADVHPAVRQRARPDENVDRGEHVGAAGRLGDHRHPRLRLGRLVGRGPVRRRPGLPRADRDDRRRGTERALPFAGGRAADRLGPVAGRGRRAAVADARAHPGCGWPIWARSPPRPPSCRSSDCRTGG